MLPLLVTAAVIRRGNEVLLTRRPDGTKHAGFWEFPGGKLDRNESPEECLIREIREELDLEISVEGIFEVAYYRYDWGPVLILAYLCAPLSKRILDLEVAEHRWVPLTELAGYDILPADAPIVGRLAGTP